MDTLILVKYLRSEGYDVVIEPNNGKPIEYLYKKGMSELFAYFANIILVGVPMGVITNIISNKIQKLLDKEKIFNKNNINIKIDNSINNYNCYGELQDKENCKVIEKNRQELKDGFEKCFEIKSPYDNLPTPIFLEHQPKIVGWGRLWIDDKGLRTEIKIMDEVTKREISQNRLNGLSVTGIATKTECSICKSDFVSCNHIPGEIYGGEKCSNKIFKTDYVETSIVKEPINSQCLIDYK